MTTIAGTTGAAIAMTMLLSAPAHAYAGNYGCSTTGALGKLTAHYVGPIGNPSPNPMKVILSLKDTKGDDHHARIRYLSKDRDGVVTKWKWRANTGGNGNLEVWETTASYTNNYFTASGVEVARFEGGTLLNSCTDWTAA
ncbi:hypothetical protein [Streptomyces mesophilus]|uniref:hypothetical protein n=1 Tax=Streptomyces mesophilus TaxID=1775132 RepID=UPI003329292C